MKSIQNKRRQFLQLGLGATAGILAGGIGCKNANGETVQATPAETACATTPEQDLGPFYPHVKNGDGDVDLTTIKGKTGQAEGVVILVRGVVRDENCQPLEGALVEIWQANKHGRYSHEGDANNAIPLDPHFEGWGEMRTGADGAYSFKTIKPGSYPVTDTDWRTPHIHFKISRRGYHEVVTQLYFEGEELNETDMVIAEMPVEERAQFIVTPGDEKGVPVFKFDLSLCKVATQAERIAAFDACLGNYELKREDGKTEVLTFRKDGQQFYLDMQGYTSVELKPGGKDELLARAVLCRYLFNRTAEGAVKSVTSIGTSKSEYNSPTQEARKL